MRYRAFFSFALLMAGFAAFAQSGNLRYFEATEALERTDLKFVIQSLTDLDPMAEVFHSDDMRILQVRSNQLSESEIRTAIQSTGRQLRPGTPDLSSYQPAPSADAPPIYVVSGNEAEDLVRYRAEVERWNEAHPDQPYSSAPLNMNDR